MLRHLHLDRHRAINVHSQSLTFERLLMVVCAGRLDNLLELRHPTLVMVQDTIFIAAVLTAE